MKPSVLYRLARVLVVGALAFFLLSSVLTLLISLLVSDSLFAGGVIRAAVTEPELAGKDYIICEPAATTVFDWEIVSDSDWGKRYEYCNLLGPVPRFSYDFEVLSGNRFVFYVTERSEHYSEEWHETFLTFTVTGWDVLLPEEEPGLLRAFWKPWGATDYLQPRLPYLIYEND